MLKLLVFAVILLLDQGSTKEESKSSVWPKNKVILSDSFLPAVTQVLTYLLDKIDEMEPAVDGPEVVQVVLLSPPPTTSTASSTVTILNATSSGGDVTTVRTVVVDGEDILKHRIPGLKPPSASSPKPSVVEIVLGRLRDMLAHEAKRQGFAKIQGYSRTVLDTLAKTSTGTSEEQLKMLMELMLQNNDVRRRDSVAQATLVLEGLSKATGPLQKALANIPPLKFTL